jgi:peptidoglycan hydrolase-like protein with peptidoglycan-binding domain
MRKYVFIILVLVLAIYITGCGRKHAELEELQTPMSMETPSTLPIETKVTPEARPQEMPSAPAKLESPLPSGPYKPTVGEIQTALHNAGLYTGKIDGKIGPLTKKAIEEFQRANSLKIDGIVGPKTWEVLSKYLNPAPVAPAQAGLKKR